ncbi:MAG: transglutaminase domain-containing protein [Candidatus ainarchaeum sp.]|nr:transglutaminase domain-containing protein [Candidatus ainarchaeum sp.]
MRKIIIILFIFLIITIVFAESFYPTTINELDANIKIYGFGEVSNLEEGQEVTFQTITFKETEFQKVRILKEALYINNKTIYPEYVFDEFDNKHIKFRITENGEFNYEIIAQVQTTALLHKIEDINIGNYPENIKNFTQRSELIESTSTEILTIASNKLINNNFTEILNQTIFWVNDYVEYAQGEEFYQYYLLQKSAIDTLLSKKGVCDEFANLAASLLRAKNIPTRLVIGVTFDGLEWGNHAWLEAYHENYGWIPSDPTFREAGFVDGTHIKMGSFTDITLSQAKAIFPSNASITFQTQTLPEVQINSKKFFSHIDLKWNEKKLKANQWNEIEIEVTNKTNGLLTIPVKILTNYDSIEFYKKYNSNIFFYDKTKSISLKGGEKGKMVFKVYPKIDLKNNEIASGQLTFNSLTEPHTINFEITPSEEKHNGEVIVKDITPISTVDKMRFEVNISNNTNKEEEIKITINDSNSDYKIGAFQNVWIRKEIESDNNTYLIKIITPTEQYSQKIYQAIQKIIQIEDTKTKETTITQEIETEKQSLFEQINIIEIMIFAMLPIIAIILLILFATRKKYV